MIQGFIESIRPFQVRGWAFDEQWPEDHLVISARIDDEILAVGVADLYRQDLVASADGSGRHGFILNFNIPLAVADGDRIAVSVVSRDGHESLLLRLSIEVDAFDALDIVTDTNTEILNHVAIGRIEVHEKEARELSHHPVFVLGSARSGTSAIAQGLIKSTRYDGDEEGHLFEVVSLFDATLRAFYDSRGEEWGTGRATTLARVPQAYLQAGFKRLMIETARELFPTGYWIDKTPRREMIRSAPILREIWPDARFIFAKRRGLENIQSRLKKFPSISFRDHCVDWTESMQSWLSVQEQLQGTAIEIDQIDLAREPLRVAEQLGAFINLHPTEISSLGAAFQYDQPERTSTFIARAVALEDLRWSDAEIEMFRSICGETMDIYSYTMTDDYRI